MDNLVTLAIVGTGQAGKEEITTGTPIDALTTQISGSMERKLLLTAGARSLYQQAGKLAESAPDAPPIAEQETLAPTTFNTYFLTKLLSDDRQLMREAAERMQQAQLRLPYELLPLALTAGAQTKELRATLAPILGKRGRWLAQFNPAWSWIMQHLEDANAALPDNAETIWQEGTQGQRGEILQRLRAIDPAKARQWLEKVWKEEKADARVAFLKTCEIGLSTADEPFLEQALDDRSLTIRTTAVSLLALLPTSALARRMQERADAMLSYENERLTITPPVKTMLNQEWKRDGINVDATHVIGESATVLKQVLIHVPPRHWEERFHVTPTQLIDALKENDWELEIIDSWSKAAIRYNDIEWIAPLLDWLYYNKRKTTLNPSDLQREKPLLSALPKQEAERMLLRSISDGRNSWWMNLLAELPRPWSEEFSGAYLYMMREHVHTLIQYNYELSRTLTIAALALPSTYFDAAVDTWEEPEEIKSDWIVQHWRQEIANFTGIITIRKRIIEEIN